MSKDAPVLLKRPSPPRFDRDVDVAVIGDAFVDILAPVTGMPQWGQDLEAASISQMAGGSALNVAVDLGELVKGHAGVQCAFYGMVGDDEFGGFLRRRLTAGGVLDRMQTAAGSSTGCCIVLSGSDDRGFVTSIGATGLLSPAQLGHLMQGGSEEGLAKRLHVHVSGFFSCFALQPALADYLRKLRSCAAERGQEVTISFDTNCDATGKWASGVVDVLRECDVFLPNEIEAVAIAKAMGTLSEAPELKATGLLSVAALDAMAGADASTGATADSKAELFAAADRLAATVRQAVVITCGKEGCILHTRRAKEAGQPPRHLGAPRGIEPVDATGAGDAFDAGFIYRWAVCGGTLEDAVCSGSCCGALCTESVGANSNPTSAEKLSAMEAVHRNQVHGIA